MKRHWTLVTGASGFVGAALVRKLVEKGVCVKAFVRPNADLSPFRDLPEDRYELAYGDVTIESTLYRALIGCDRVFHVASVFRYWSTHPDRIIAPAVNGTRAMLAAARAHDIERIVVTSSAAVLGTTREEPMNEEHTSELRDPELYIRAKIEADRVVSEAVASGMPIISVLPTGIFGPGDRKPTPNGRVLLEYLKTRPGQRLMATDGGFSVVDVDDVATGHVLAMEKGRVGERYILGGENTTFRGFIELLHELTGLGEPGRTASKGLLELAGRALELSAHLGGPDPLLTHRLARDYAFERVWVTSEKAERELGYTHRPAREAVSRAIQWYLSHGFVPEPLATRVRLELRPI